MLSNKEFLRDIVYHFHESLLWKIVLAFWVWMYIVYTIVLVYGQNFWLDLVIIVVYLEQFKVY